MRYVTKAFVDIHNTAGIGVLCRSLQRGGVELLAARSTLRYLERLHIVATDLGRTGVAPRLFAEVALLRKEPERAGELLLVIANMGQKSKQPLTPEEFERETLLRYAARNFDRIAVVVRPEDYEKLREILSKGKPPAVERQRWAMKTYQHLAEYDVHVAHVLGGLMGGLPELKRRGESSSDIAPERTPLEPSLAPLVTLSSEGEVSPLAPVALGGPQEATPKQRSFSPSGFSDHQTAVYTPPKNSWVDLHNRETNLLPELTHEVLRSLNPEGMSYDTVSSKEFLRESQDRTAEGGPWAETGEEATSEAGWEELFQVVPHTVSKEGFQEVSQEAPGPQEDPVAECVSSSRKGHDGGLLTGEEESEAFQEENDEDPLIGGSIEKRSRGESLPLVSSALHDEKREEKLLVEEYRWGGRKRWVYVAGTLLLVLLGAGIWYALGRETEKMHLSAAGPGSAPAPTGAVATVPPTIKGKSSPVRSPQDVRHISVGKGTPSENRLVQVATSKKELYTLTRAGCRPCVEKGLLALERSQYGLAAKLFLTSLKSVPRDPETRALLSLAYHAGKRDKLALQEAVATLSLDPSSRWALLVAGSTQQILGHYKDAVPYYETFLRVTRAGEPFHTDIMKILRGLSPHSPALHMPKRRKR